MVTGSFLLLEQKYISLIEHRFNTEVQVYCLIWILRRPHFRDVRALITKRDMLLPSLFLVFVEYGTLDTYGDHKMDSLRIKELQVRHGPDIISEQLYETFFVSCQIFHFELLSQNREDHTNNADFIISDWNAVCIQFRTQFSSWAIQINADACFERNPVTELKSRSWGSLEGVCRC